MTLYLDYCATTPVEPRVLEVVLHYLREEFGNAGSRTHEFGLRAKKAVELARRQVAAVVDAQADEVTFTSGATESNNLAILGLAEFGLRTGRRHVVSTQIEHKAVLEPLEQLVRRGFEVSLVRPTAGGWVEPEAVAAALRPDTLLVSVMQVNNETGVIQPLDEISRHLRDHGSYFHVDAAQGFGKELESLREKRIDLISVSGHKIYAPKGVGALIARRRRFERPPLEPLMYGGGQERGLRPGTLPVHLIAGLGKAAELASAEAGQRRQRCTAFRDEVLRLLAPLEPEFNGDPSRCAPHVLNFSVKGLDSEAFILATKGIVAVSNGAACTSQAYKRSHVLEAMGLTAERCDGAVRLSWSAESDDATVSEVARAVAGLNGLASPRGPHGATREGMAEPNVHAHLPVTGVLRLEAIERV